MHWIEINKGTRPFAAGALAFIQGKSSYYGCHFGMRSTLEWTRTEFESGWLAAQKDWEAR